MLALSSAGQVREELQSKGGTLQEKSDSEMRLFSPFNSQSLNWAPTVEIRPLSSVPCVYSTCIKEAFISLEQIINTFHQRCEGGGLALEKKKKKSHHNEELPES